MSPRRIRIYPWSRLAIPIGDAHRRAAHRVAKDEPSVFMACDAAGCDQRIARSYIVNAPVGQHSHPSAFPVVLSDGTWWACREQTGGEVVRVFCPDHQSRAPQS